MISLNGEEYNLKYLFEAEYKDGTVYKQGADDKSVQKDGKNSFFDIYYEPIKPLEELVRFSLVGDGHIYSVYFPDGHFELDGVRTSPAPFSEPLRLVFFKTHTHQYNMAGAQTAHDITYGIGWQTTVNGENKQFLINAE